MLSIYTESVVFVTKPALDCLTEARKIYDALRDSFPPGREAEPCIRDLLYEVGGILTTRTSAVNGLGQLVPKLDYAGQGPAYTTDKTRQFRDRLTQCLGLPFEDYEQIELSTAFTLVSPSPVRGWDGRPHQNAHLAAVSMVEIALSLLVAGSRLDLPHLLSRFGGTERRLYREAILAHRKAIRRRAKGLPDPGPVAAALVDAIQAEHERVSEVLAAWEESTLSEGGLPGVGQSDPASLPSDHPEAPGQVESGDYPYRFERRGRIWGFRFGDEAGACPHCVGFTYINYLLARPGKSIQALELQQAKDGPRGRSVSKPCQVKDEDEEEFWTTQTSQPTLDPRAKNECRKRMIEIAAELRQARSVGDEPKVERLEDEFHRLRAHLKSARGFAGRQRPLGPPPPGEKARVAVRKALSRAYEALRSATPALPSLAKHLEDCIQVNGFNYGYHPPRPIPVWQL
jgi:hypothetical protein